MEKKITSTNTKGFIIAAVLIALDIIIQLTYKTVPDGVRYMPRVGIVFVGVLAACILYSKQSGGGLSFGDLFSHGFKIAAVVAFIMAAYTFICIKFIYPPPGPAEMDEAVKAIEQRGSALHQEAVQQAMEGARNRWVIYVSVSIFAALIPGLFGAALGAAVIKKR